jgi:DNA-directed RNA polymerase specialized sigma24 family protein
MVAVKATASARVGQAPRTVEPEPASFDALSALSGERRRVCTALLRYGVEPCEVDDLASAVLLAAVESIATFRPGAEPLRSLRAWLICGIAKNKASHHREAREAERRKLARLALAFSDASVPSPEPRIAARERLACTLSTIDGMPAPTREVLLRYSVEGERMEDIGAALKIPVPTAYKHFYRAVVLLARVDAKNERAPLSHVRRKGTR